MIGPMGPIQELALELGAEERTLRRALVDGALRARRPGPRRLRLEPGEHEYLGSHWSLISELRRALRTEWAVRLAVLYGSLARGDEDSGSDLDLLVESVDGRSAAGFGLTQRLEAISGRRVDIARLDRVEAQAPLLLDRVLDEGRVLVDREELWPPMRERRRAIRARARRAHRRQMASASRAIAEICG